MPRTRIYPSSGPPHVPGVTPLCIPAWRRAIGLWLFVAAASTAHATTACPPDGDGATSLHSPKAPQCLCHRADITEPYAAILQDRLGDVYRVEVGQVLGDPTEGAGGYVLAINDNGVVIGHPAYYEYDDYKVRPRPVRTCQAADIRKSKMQRNVAHSTDDSGSGPPQVTAQLICPQAPATDLNTCFMPEIHLTGPFTAPGARDTLRIEHDGMPETPAHGRRGDVRLVVNGQALPNGAASRYFFDGVCRTPTNTVVASTTLLYGGSSGQSANLAWTFESHNGDVTATALDRRRPAAGRRAFVCGAGEQTLPSLWDNALPRISPERDGNVDPQIAGQHRFVPCQCGHLLPDPFLALEHEWTALPLWPAPGTRYVGFPKRWREQGKPFVMQPSERSMPRAALNDLIRRTHEQQGSHVTVTRTASDAFELLSVIAQYTDGTSWQRLLVTDLRKPAPHTRTLYSSFNNPKLFGTALPDGFETPTRVRLTTCVDQCLFGGIVGTVVLDLDSMQVDARPVARGVE